MTVIDFASQSQDDCFRPDLLKAGWPPALIKSLLDPFEYAAGIRTGWVMVFTEADDIGNGWVRLKEARSYMEGPNAPSEADQLIFERGFEVRVSEIVWVCDAPHGS